MKILRHFVSPHKCYIAGPLLRISWWVAYWFIVCMCFVDSWIYAVGFCNGSLPGWAAISVCDGGGGWGWTSNSHRLNRIINILNHRWSFLCALSTYLYIMKTDIGMLQKLVDPQKKSHKYKLKSVGLYYLCLMRILSQLTTSYKQLDEYVLNLEYT